MARVTAQEQLTLAFVSSAYNEAENLDELYRRCLDAHASIQHAFAGKLNLQFRFVVSDNGSSDNSVAVMNKLSSEDKAVMALVNKANYGPEPSAANALLQARDCDLFVLLLSWQSKWLPICSSGLI
jgi:glycosyltransferase involved in cell wall biosynthesis